MEDGSVAHGVRVKDAGVVHAVRVWRMPMLQTECDCGRCRCCRGESVGDASVVKGVIVRRIPER